MNKLIYLYILLSCIILSCTKSDQATEFVQKVTEYPEVSISSSTIEESNGLMKLEFHASNNLEGNLFYAITNEKVSLPSDYDIIKGNFDSALESSLLTVGANAYPHESRSLKPSKKYYVYSVFKSIDDEVSTVKIDSIETNDITSPVLLANFCTPQYTQETDLELNIDLFFNEAVFKNENTSVLVQVENENNIKEYIYGIDDLKLNGNVVSIVDENLKLDYDSYIVVSAAEGAFEDLAGNMSREIKGLVDTDITNVDYYFYTRSESRSDLMANFIGSKNLRIATSNGEIFNDIIEVKLKSYSSEIIEIESLWGDKINVRFSLLKGSLMFPQTESSVYYSHHPSDLNRRGLYYGTPNEYYHYRVYYMPISLESAGSFNKEGQEFNFTYELKMELGSLGLIEHYYAES